KIMHQGYQEPHPSSGGCGDLIGHGDGPTSLSWPGRVRDPPRTRTSHELPVRRHCLAGHRAGPQRQNDALKENWIWRGLLTWLVILPNKADPKEVLGGPNSTRLNALKNSAPKIETDTFAHRRKLRQRNIPVIDALRLQSRIDTRLVAHGK